MRLPGKAGRFYGPALLVALVLGAGWSLVRRPPAARSAPPPVRSRSEAPAGWKWEGVGSCAASACHGGSGPAGSKGSEYTTWATRDPHARAYEILYDRRSRQIVRNLEGKDSPPEKNARCLSCHAMAVDPSHQGPRFTIQDGVGCESCHGPAEKWLGEHYLARWKGLSDRDKERLGFQPTKDLLVRARQCVACHVGSGERDVNHDLIAAGHPRLNFELGAYLGILLKHWDVTQDKKRHPDYESRVWALGQLASAKASLDLLAQRAEKGVWPEFAEYNCFACHHDLREPSWRQEREKSSGLAGTLPWGTWYFSDVLSQALTPGETTALQVSLRELRKEMQRPFPDKDWVRGLARETADRLQPGLKKLAAAPTADPEILRKRLSRLRREAGKADTSWDEAVQRYLALAALHAGLSDLGEQDPRLRASLRRRAKELAFPKGYDSPRNFSPDRGKGPPR